MLPTIVAAAAAAFALHRAGVEICSRPVQRLAAALGAARADQRDSKAAWHRRRELPAPVAEPPEGVAVEVEGGCLRTRAVGQGPGVQQQQNQEAKRAGLVTLSRAVPASDPQPEPPESFREPRRVPRRVPPRPGLCGDKPQEDPGQADASTAPQPAAASPARPEPPRKRLRTGGARRADVHSLGPMGAAEAQQRNFYRAKRGASRGDGAASNGTTKRGSFWNFEAITDLLPVLCSLSLAAWGVGAAWPSGGRSTSAG